MTIQEAFTRTIALEGGNTFTDIKNDAGGATRYGISKNANPDIDVLNLTEDKARDIYYERYWKPAFCDILPNQLQFVVFDAAINNGVKEAIELIQHASGCVVDGIYGAETAQACKNVSAFSYLTWRDWFYDKCVENNPKDAEFIDGWKARTQKIRVMIQNNQI